MKTSLLKSGAIGNTALVRLSEIEKYYGLSVELFGKLERGNMTGSVKDRPALFMLNDFEKRGLIGRGKRIVIATSGNMGISLSALCARRGYRIVVIMPKSVSVERQEIILALGGELILTEGGMSESVRVEEEISKSGEGVSLCQFDNQMNAYAHEKTTGPEIYRDTYGMVDAFVAGVGTGGTISGVGRYLKEKKPSVKVIAVEPSESAVLSGGEPSTHLIQGIGAGFLPTILDKNVINEVKTVSFPEAKRATDLLATREGIPAGISSGAALAAAVSFGQRSENRGMKIVVLLPDGMEKYLSSR